MVGICILRDFAHLTEVSGSALTSSSSSTSWVHGEKYSPGYQLSLTLFYKQTRNADQGLPKVLAGWNPRLGKTQTLPSPLLPPQSSLWKMLRLPFEIGAWLQKCQIKLDQIIWRCSWRDWTRCWKVGGYRQTSLSFWGGLGASSSGRARLLLGQLTANQQSHL